MNLYLGLIGWLLFFAMCGIFYYAWIDALNDEGLREAARHNNRKE